MTLLILSILAVIFALALPFAYVMTNRIINGALCFVVGLLGIISGTAGSLGLTWCFEALGANADAGTWIAAGALYALVNAVYCANTLWMSLELRTHDD